jgi:hypothetical protein
MIDGYISYTHKRYVKNQILLVSRGSSGMLETHRAQVI